MVVFGVVVLMGGYATIHTFLGPNDIRAKMVFHDFLLMALGAVVWVLIG